MSTEEKLITGEIRINTASFEMLYRLYWKKMYTIGYRYTEDVEQAKEVVQEVFKGLWERRDTLTIVGSAENYLIRAAKLKILERVRSQSRIQEHLSAAGYMQPQQANVTEDEIRFKEQYQQWQEGVAALPEKCRQVYQLSQQTVLTPQQIAARLNLSAKTVENYLSQANRLLRKKIL